ncbi:class I SAM-dependent methyltransferase [Geminicoccus flavidas]|uniref:class I SAM-dependent methyltransferase n=1 Tax=Geminicoccus flavidas TaxID=2506407 RepID=UPI00135945AF|nr:class I SAM-dependent methyltransferase [Geminicoccus flavidas]
MTQSDYVASNPLAYERQMGRWSSRLAANFIRFARIGDAAHILDLGCGTGSLAFALAEAMPGARITGVDVSAPYIAYARLQASTRPLVFAQGDATSLRHPDQSFDAVLSLLALNFISRTEQAVREMVRVAKLGAVVAAAVWDFRGGLTFLRVLMDTAAMLDPDGEKFRARMCTGLLTGPGELAGAWTAAGLSEVEQASLTIRMEFRSFADYFEPWLAGQGTVGAYVATRTLQQRALIEHHVRQAYLAGSDEGPRSFAATAWVVRGVR